MTEETQQCVVILGAPGASKTSLINYLARVAASCDRDKHPSKNITVPGVTGDFPVLIRVRNLARGPEVSVLDFLKRFVEIDLNVGAVPTGFFEYWLEAGQAMILIDGLDEVANDVQRRQVVEKIETFLSAYNDCRVIITARPAGYRNDDFSRDDYPHYQLLPFADDHIEEIFINHWYTSQTDLRTERKPRKRSFRRALVTQPYLKPLARNPLLLTVITLMHQHQAHLPKQRHQFYNSAVAALISIWNTDQALTSRHVLKYLDIGDIQRLMQQLAYWIHTQGSVGDTKNGTHIERQALIQQLSQFIQEMKTSEHLQQGQAEAEAIDFLDKIVEERAGLLSKQGHNRYAFIHKIFQAYLCAAEILYRQQAQDFDDEDRVSDVESYIHQYLHDPHWQAVLLLLIAQQPANSANVLLQIILNANKA